MGAKNCRAARGTAIESAHVREKVRCVGDDGIALGARPRRAKKAMLHRAWQAGRRPQRKLLPATCCIASLILGAGMKEVLLWFIHLERSYTNCWWSLCGGRFNDPPGN